MRICQAFWEKFFYYFFSHFLLTNCWGYVIIEISRMGPVGARLKKPKEKGSAVSQAHSAPTQNADLVVRSADCDGFALGAYSETVVDIVDAIF